MRLFKPAVFAVALASAIAFFVSGCSTGPEETVTTASAAQTSSCVAFNGNPYPGAASQICDGFASAFKFFATGGHPETYTDTQHWELGLSLFGWPIDQPHAEDVEGQPDYVQTFERTWMNMYGGCPYGACIARAGASDLGDVTPGMTGDCNSDDAIARDLGCIGSFGYPSLTAKIDKLGDQALNYWGYPLTKPGPCDWWDQGNLTQRTCIWTERAKLGYFPENGWDYQWQGELLGTGKLAAGGSHGEDKCCKVVCHNCPDPKDNGVLVTPPLKQHQDEVDAAQQLKAQCQRNGCDFASKGCKPDYCK